VRRMYSSSSRYSFRSGGTGSSSRRPRSVSADRYHSNVGYSSSSRMNIPDIQPIRRSASYISPTSYEPSSYSQQHRYQHEPYTIPASVHTPSYLSLYPTSKMITHVIDDQPVRRYDLVWAYPMWKYLHGRTGTEKPTPRISTLFDTNTRVYDPYAGSYTHFRTRSASSTSAHRRSLIADFGSSSSSNLGYGDRFAETYRQIRKTVSNPPWRQNNERLPYRPLSQRIFSSSSRWF